MRVVFSFLAVLKVFGKQDDLISFPKEGYTLALDFPVRKGLFEFLDELDEIVLKNGGQELELDMAATLSSVENVERHHCRCPARTRRRPGVNMEMGLPAS